jgi:hypothetical protein
MVAYYAAGDWTPADAEYHRVSIDRVPCAYESACSSVEIFDDPLPDDLMDALLAKIHYGHQDLKEDLAAKKSYFKRRSGAASLDAETERRIPPTGSPQSARVKARSPSPAPE